MGYSKRATKKFCDCRPKEYKYSNELPKPRSICNRKCPYFIFCNPEVNNMTIGERLKEIRLVTQRPYHLFQYLGEELGIMLVLESIVPEERPRLSFRGTSIIGAIESAEKYIEKEIKVGAIVG